MSTDWESEQYNSPHNIPGEPDQVAALGKHYRDVADAIKTQAENIRNLVNGNGWDSDSGREFQKTAGETAEKLEKAYSRYDAAATAIGTVVYYPPSTGTWSMSLAHAQELAKAAILKGRNAQAAGKTAQTQIDQATAANGGKPDTSPAAVRMADEKSGHDADMLQAEKDMQAARDLRDQQANKAADAIVYAYKHDGLKDSGWDKFKGAVEDWAQIIGHWAGLAASILGVLALVFSWVPVLGEVLGALAAIASVVALVCDIINVADGRGTWLDLGIDVLGVLSCGAGRLLGNAAKGAKFFETLNAFKGTQMAKGLRFAKAGKAAGLTGGRASKIATANKFIGDLPTAFGPRMAAYGKAAVNPKLYWQGMKEGAKDFSYAGIKGAFKPTSFPFTMMSPGGAARYGLWATGPVAGGWANLGEVTYNTKGNDSGNVWTAPDGFVDYKKDPAMAPLGFNGIPGINFKPTAG